MEAKLDALLEFTRDPAPADDLFVGRVMGHVRANVERRARRRRMYTRPTALAAAVVIVLGGAVAALVRSTDTPQDVASGPTPQRPIATRSDANDDIARPGRKAGTATEQADVPPRREGDLEWGYKGRTTAYAVDHETGLRLQTQIARTEIDTGVPQSVTLTLTNTGSKTLVVSAPRGCALVVGAFLADERDGTDTHPWQCATTQDDAGTPQQDESFVMEPDDRITGEATLVLGAAGDWRLVGMCRCTYRAADEPTPKPKADNPLDGLPLLATTWPPIGPSDERPAEQSKDLVTPPIRVRAS